MTQEIKHTPLPWTYMKGKTLIHIESSIDAKESGLPVCSIPKIREKDATFIARACNSHYDLIAALEDARKTLAMMIAPDAIKQTTVLNAYAAAVEAEYKARQALSKAKGETE